MTEPANGIWKNRITIPVITIVRSIAIIKGGIDLPRRISGEDNGLTISWSKVPSSLSLAIERAVKIKVVTSDNMATITVKIYHLYSRFGLNQLRTEGFIPAPIEAPSPLVGKGWGEGISRTHNFPLFLKVPAYIRP